MGLFQKPKRKTKNKKSIGKRKAEVWKVFSQYIRMRDALRTTGTLEYSKCICCPHKPPQPIKEMDAGHFIPGHSGENYFHEKGVHAQFKYCNGPLSGNQYAYGQEIVKLYGPEIVDELRRAANTPVRWKLWMLDELESDLKAKIADMRKQCVVC